MRSHKHARGLVVSGLLAVIVGVILLLGMVQSFSSGNTQTGFVLLVILAVNILGNIIYGHFATKRAHNESRPKASMSPRIPAADVDSNNQTEEPSVTPVVAELAFALFNMASGDEDADRDLVACRLDRDIDPEVMRKELFHFRAFAADFGVTQALGYTSLRNEVLDAFHSLIAVTRGIDFYRTFEARNLAYSQAVNTSGAPAPFWFVGKTFCLQCSEHPHVPQLMEMVQYFVQLCDIVVRNVKLPAAGSGDHPAS